MLNTSFEPWPSFSEEEADAVKQVLLSNRVNYWTGQETRQFEKEFAAWCGVDYAVSVANGTVALELALKSLNLPIGSEVVVTPRTFVASASAIVNAGFTPIFADVDRDSQCITAETIESALSPRTAAIVCVHLGGHPCDMDPIIALARQHNLRIIEDCAQAHGALYKGQSIGSWGDVAAWSFCQDKIMTTGGEGGMITTNDRSLWSRAWSLKDHGKSYEAVYERDHAPGFRWLHESFGTNARMLEMQAVIGRIQLKRMPEWHRQRTENAKRLAEVCAPYPAVRVPTIPPDCTHAWYRFYAFVEPHHLADGWSRNRIIKAIQAKGIPCYQGSCSEIYLEKAFGDAGLAPPVRLPVAKELGETSICMLVHPTLSADDMQRSCDALEAVLSEASI